MANSKEENSYRSILKGTSSFGGVQLFNILVGLLRGKLVALFLGPSGMGISSLFSTAGATLQQFASLGLNLAIVKEISASKNDAQSLSTALTVAKRLILTTALAGAIICALAAPLLSEWTFGDASHTIGFVLLAAMVFFAIAGAGALSILQGLRMVKRLSMASLVGGLAGLCLGVPCYWFWGTAGIVPALIAISLSTFCFYTWSLRKANLPPEGKFVWQEHSPMVRRLVSLGIVLMAGSLIGTLTTYLINTFVRTFGSYETIGLYQAANSITNQYVGVVFSAMSLDFFPRLTAVATDNRKMTAVVNRQIEIVALILTPIVIALFLTAPLIIRLLLTEQFTAAIPLMRWLGLGVLIRGIIYPMGYISFAKENKRLFFWLEGIVGNLLNLILSCALFFYFGLDGLGISLVASCTITFFIYYAVNRRNYRYALSQRSAISILASVTLGTAAFALTYLPDKLHSNIAISVILAATLLLTLITLRKVLRR